MTQVIINLALRMITSKVEEVLADIGSESHQEPLASNAFREELVAYVMRRMPAVYTTTEMSQADMNETHHCFTPEQQDRIVVLVHEGIRYLNHSMSWQLAAVAATQDIEPSPSHWFG
jgi:hypothetical protein